MGSLLASLSSASGTLEAFQRALEVVQNNVSNARTPGYVQQRQQLTAMPFDPATGSAGGVGAGVTLSARSGFAEQAVRERTSSFRGASQLAVSLGRLEPTFDISASKGLSAAMDRFFQSASQLSTTPNDLFARDLLLVRAGELADGFRSGAGSLARANETVDGEIRAAVERTNALAGRLAKLNREFRPSGSARDAGLDAQLHSLLEDLADLAEFTALAQEDGSIFVLLAGEIPLVVGDTSFELGAEFTASGATLVGANGEPTAGAVRRGRLGALLETRNTIVPSLSGELDRLARHFADRVNETLLNGVDMDGQPPSEALFTYSATNGPASTLTVAGITARQLAAAAPSAPGGNGNALQLVSLADSPEIDGLSFTAYYGKLAANLGGRLESARHGVRVEESLLAQSKSLREEISAVSLDEEALYLIQFQRSYEAAARMVTVLDELTQTVIGILR